MCRNVFLAHMHAVPTDASRGCQISHTAHDRWVSAAFGCWELNPGTLQGQVVLSTLCHVSSPSAPIFLKKCVKPFPVACQVLWPHLEVLPHFWSGYFGASDAHSLLSERGCFGASDTPTAGAPQALCRGATIRLSQLSLLFPKHRS